MWKRSRTREYRMPEDPNFQQHSCGTSCPTIVILQFQLNRDISILTQFSCAEVWFFVIRTLYPIWIPWLWWRLIPYTLIVIKFWGQLQFICYFMLFMFVFLYFVWERIVLPGQVVLTSKILQKTNRLLPETPLSNEIAHINSLW